MEIVRSTDHYRRRPGEFQGNNPPARLYHPGHFLKEKVKAGDIPQGITDGDTIKGVIREGEFQGVTQHQMDRLIRVTSQFFPGLGQHLRAEIQTDYPARPVFTDDIPCHLRGTGGQVQHQPAGFEFAFSGGENPPHPVLTKAEQTV